MTKYQGYFIVDRNLFVGFNKHGHETLLSWKSPRGIPKNAAWFGSKHEAEMEIGFMQRLGKWPLCDFKVELRTWR